MKLSYKPGHQTGRVLKKKKKKKYPIYKKKKNKLKVNFQSKE